MYKVIHRGRHTTETFKISMMWQGGAGSGIVELCFHIPKFKNLISFVLSLLSVFRFMHDGWNMETNPIYCYVNHSSSLRNSFQLLILYLCNSLYFIVKSFIFHFNLFILILSLLFYHSPSYFFILILHS